LVKVLIGSPLHDSKNYVIRDFLDNVKSLDGDFDFYGVDNSKNPGWIQEIGKEYGRQGFWFDRVPWCTRAFSRMVLAYNKIREKAVFGGYTHLLTLECDVFPPKNVVSRLLGYGKDVVAGVYPINMQWKNVKQSSNPRYCVWKPVPRKIFPIWFEDSDLNNGLIKWDYGFSYGCCLFNVEVFDSFVFREAKYDLASPDGIGYEDLHLAGFDTFIDTGLVCEHRYGDWVKIKKDDRKEAEYVRERARKK